MSKDPTVQGETSVKGRSGHLVMPGAPRGGGLVVGAPAREASGRKRSLRRRGGLQMREVWID